LFFRCSKQPADVIACVAAWRTPLDFQCAPKSRPFQSCYLLLMLTCVIFIASSTLLEMKTVVTYRCDIWDHRRLLKRLW
jgi:hypothetical protein